MPLFKRADGELVSDESADRLMMPHLCWGRNASAVYQTTYVDIGETREWLRAYNRDNSIRGNARTRVGLFHLFLWASAQVLNERPKLNRFVSGGRLYQRNEVVLAFSVKKPGPADAAVSTAKMTVADPDEPFSSFVERLAARIAVVRDGDVMVERELELGARLPHLVTRFALTGYRVADRFNLLPASLQDSDPSYSSLFVANLGSVGIDNTFHHLFELGTNGLFACLGRARRNTVVHTDGRIEQRSRLAINWTFDERVADGAYCAAALREVSALLGNPARKLGHPGAATKADSASLGK